MNYLLTNENLYSPQMVDNNKKKLN